MHRSEKMKDYQKEVRRALGNDFLRQAMDKFAVAYREARETVFEGMDKAQLIEDVARRKDAAIADVDRLLAQFKDVAKEKGIFVHMADDAQHANEIIATIAQMTGSKKIIKSKSMTAEETLLNHYLELKGYEVTETDLGEWIIQLRGEGPSHMVMPAIHLSRFQVADLFTDVTGNRQDHDIEKLVKVARRELRPKFVEADMGITGANFAIADTATIGLVTNEGNARLVATLPRVHVALVGLEKLMPTLQDALAVLKVLPRNATGQRLTSYVTWVTGATPWQGEDSKAKEIHIVFLDNGRGALARDAVFSQVLRCVRCGACANVCPVYRMVGGHQMGHIYIGAIGLILTYFFHGRTQARNLIQNCINCGACKEVCAAGIDLPGLIKQVHAKIINEEGHPLKSTLLSKVLRNRKLFHTLLRYAQKAQKPITDDQGYLRHLPHIFSKEHRFREIPAIDARPFRDRWASIRPVVHEPKYRIALFSGCVQDFVYPEHLTAAVDLFAGQGVAVTFPMDQSCCGLPVQMMGELDAARQVAIQNVMALTSDPVDYVITLCASCASHLKMGYPKMLADSSSMALNARRMAEKVLSFSSFCCDVLKLDPSLFKTDGPKMTYHAPCHLCRGLGVKEAPKTLIRNSGYDFVPAVEEETCCGFGGTYSATFPSVSSQILERKMADIQSTGAEVLVTECPGCIMQLQGGAAKRGLKLEVAHLSQVLKRHLKP
ncbi:MAG: LUD domain-containing protein [Desulfobacteraceae bacterium]|jgi:iron-sulfur cluster protein